MNHTIQENGPEASVKTILALCGRKAESVSDERCAACRAKGACRAYAAPHLAAARFFAKRTGAKAAPPEPAALSDRELGEALALARPFREWLAAVEDYALGAALDGKTIPGWKLVEGKQGNRKFSDPDAAVEALKAEGVEEDLLYERKPLSPAQLEKTLGKAVYQAVAEPFVTRAPAKLLLAPEGDPRPAFHPAAGTACASRRPAERAGTAG